MEPKLHQKLGKPMSFVRVYKIVISDLPDYPAYVRNMSDLSNTIESMLDGHPVFSYEQKDVSITISHEFMEQGKFEALEPWEP